MKRSEALEEIRKILAMNGKDDGMGELEEALLHHLESLGMLPPESSRSRRVMMFDLQHVQFAHIWDENDFFEQEEPEE